MGVDADETNVTAADITASIIEASDEIDLLTHTTYHSAEDSGTATSGTTGTLTDTNQSWTADTYEDYVLWIYSGTGSGQYARIASNTTTALTFNSDDTLTTAPDSTSKYRVIPNAIKSESYDGNDLATFYLPYYPIVSLLALDIAGTTVTPANVYTYDKIGKLQLHIKIGPETTAFIENYPQCITVKWVYGVYPIPRNIIRLTASIAAIKCLIQQIGGTYNDVTSYVIPHLSASKGEPYTNIREALTRLEKNTEKMINRIIKYPVVVS